MIIRYELRNGAFPPEKAHEDDACFDLRACESVSIPPWSIRRVNTGVVLELLPGLEGQVRPRSGMSSDGFVPMFGTVDAGYRGEISVILANLTDREYLVKVEAKIAQLKISTVAPVTLRKAFSPLSSTKRGESGFGSTGT